MASPLPKALLLPIDDQEETLLPLDFLARLYPQRDHIRLILSFLQAPLAPVYRQKPLAPAMAEKKKDLLRAREDATRKALDRARGILVAAGFSPEAMQEHIQEKELSVAHHACRLADMKKVDAVVIQRRFSSRLEAFLKGDISAALLNHCLVSPIWFVDGQVRVDRAAIGIEDGEASLRAVDHAAFMLAETATAIQLVHVSRDLSLPIHCPARDARKELAEPRRRLPALAALLDESMRILESEGIGADRIALSLLPGKTKVAATILDHCRSRGIGILVLGHKGSRGSWSFLKNSVTTAILAEANNLAVWVNQ